MPSHFGQRRPQHNPQRLKCTILGCSRWFKNVSGRTKHIRSHHSAQAAMHPRLRRRCQPSPPTAHADDAPQMSGVIQSSPQPSHPPCSPPADHLFSPLLDMGALSGGTPTQSLGNGDYPEQDLGSPSQRNSPMPQESLRSSSLVQDLPRFSRRSRSHLSGQPGSSSDFLTSVSHPLINGKCIFPMHVSAQAY